jgi:hypothetical protein
MVRKRSAVGTARRGLARWLAAITVKGMKEGARLFWVRELGDLRLRFGEESLVLVLGNAGR